MFKHYLKELHENLGYFGTWLPNAPLELGAVGVLDRDGRFRPATTLEKLLGAQPSAATGVARGPLKYHSASTVSVKFKLAGEAPFANSALTAADAGIAVEFADQNAVVFEAANCAVDRFTDVEEIGQELVARADAKMWNTQYIVITEVVRAKSTTVLMSSAAGARFDATVAADVGLSGSTIGEAAARCSVRCRDHIGVEVLAGADLTPLFSAWRVRARWYRSGTWEPARSALEGPLEQLDAESLLSQLSD